MTFEIPSPLIDTPYGGDLQEGTHGMDLELKWMNAEPGRPGGGPALPYNLGERPSASEAR